MTHKEPRFHWKCPNNPDHVFLKSPWNMIKHSGYPCPFCPSSLNPRSKLGITETSVSNSLRAISEGYLFSRIHPIQTMSELNLETTMDLRVQSPTFINWKCQNGPDHVSFLEVREVVRTFGTACSCCPPTSQISVDNSVASDSSINATQYHPTANQTLSRFVRSNDSVTPLIWKCPQGPDHVWIQDAKVRLDNSTSATCPFCDGTVGDSAEVSVQNSVANCFPNELLNQIHPIQSINAKEIRRGSSSVSMLWKTTDSPDHIWPAPPRDRNASQGNPYQQANDNDLSPSNSLAGVWPELIEEWVECVYNPELSPTTIRYSSQAMVRWNCNNHGVYDAMVGSRTIMMSRCPVCSESQGERAVREYLENRGIPYMIQRRFQECRDIKPLPFDFADTSEQCQWLVEFHGIQHFDALHHRGGQTGYDLQVLHDQIKSNWATSNSNFIMIRYDQMNQIHELLDDFFQNLNIN